MDMAILHVRHIQQRQRGECLAACAAMALDYLQIPFNYDRLKELLAVKWFGAPFFKIQNLSEMGVVVVCKERGTLDDVYEHLSDDHPCIAFVKTKELPYWADEPTDHAVIVSGLDTTHILLNDPAFNYAPIKVSRGDFELAWLERNEVYAAIARK